jgi:hypothetical protein
MTTENIKRAVIVLLHGILGWGLCGAVIFIGRSVTTMDNALLIHAFGAPIIFGALTCSYYRFFRYTPPHITAILFTGIAFCLDFFVIAPFVEKSFDMFNSVPGTWIPFGLIFFATYLVGVAMTGTKQRA